MWGTWYSVIDTLRWQRGSNVGGEGETWDRLGVGMSLSRRKDRLEVTFTKQASTPLYTSGSEPGNSSEECQTQAE